MKTLIVLMVMASVVYAGHLKFWDYGDFEYGEAVYIENWVDVYSAEITHIDYMWVYATNESDLNNAEVAIFLYGYMPDPDEYLPITYSAEPCQYGYRMRVDADYSMPSGSGTHVKVYIKVPNNSVRATTPPAGRTTRPLGSGGWQCMPYEVNVVFVGDVVSLSRTTWAEIKTSF